MTEFTHTSLVSPSGSAVHLPPEILMKVFVLLSPQELCACSRVSHQFYFVSSDDTLWKPIVSSIIQKLKTKEDGATHETSNKTGPNWRKRLERARVKAKESKHFLLRNYPEFLVEKEKEKQSGSVYTLSDAEEGEQNVSVLISWKEFLFLSIVERTENIYPPTFYSIPPPSLHLWKDWEEKRRKQDVLYTNTSTSGSFVKKVGDTVNSFCIFSPSTYKAFLPYHSTLSPRYSDQNHLSLCDPINYVRSTHCFFTNPDWFNFYTFVKNQHYKVNRIIYLLVPLFLLLASIPLCLLYFCLSMLFPHHSGLSNIDPIPLELNNNNYDDGGATMPDFGTNDFGISLGTRILSLLLFISLSHVLISPFALIYSLIFDYAKNIRNEQWMEALKSHTKIETLVFICASGLFLGLFTMLSVGVWISTPLLAMFFLYFFLPDFVPSQHKQTTLSVLCLSALLYTCLFGCLELLVFGVQVICYFWLFHGIFLNLQRLVDQLETHNTECNGSKDQKQVEKELYDKLHLLGWVPPLFFLVTVPAALCCTFYCVCSL